jgi:simple sugar transport system permease protein
MGDIGIIINAMFLLTSVLLLGGISGYLSERVGIVNVGIDGMMCFGALLFGIFSSPIMGMSKIGPAMIIFPLLLTIFFSTIMGFAHAFATIKLKANHVISGTAINLIGVALATFLNVPLGASLYNGASHLQSGFTDFLFLGNSIYGSSLIIFIIAILIAVGIYIFMQYTKTGLRYRAVGENPNAVDAQGISVYKYQ